MKAVNVKMQILLLRCNNQTIETNIFASVRLLEELNTMVTEEGGVRKRAGDRAQEGLEVLGTFVYLTELFYNSPLLSFSLPMTPCHPGFGLFHLHLLKPFKVYCDAS